MKVLELGSYFAAAYAGMVLAEQGHRVTKIVHPGRLDPIQELRNGGALWEWVNDGKELLPIDLSASRIDRLLVDADVVIENIRPEALKRWGLNPVVPGVGPQALATVWVGLRGAVPGERSFDVIAQRQAWGDEVPYIPFYIGDTAAGLWMAFKALSAFALHDYGFHPINQAACLAKLREGELAVERPDTGSQVPPWDEPGSYNGAGVLYRGEQVRAEPWDDEKRRRHLPHRDGRLLI